MFSDQKISSPEEATITCNRAGALPLEAERGATVED